jgi:uncharacterized membrane protein YkvA (DUF1232 family)
MSLSERAGRIARRVARELNFYRLVAKHPRTPRASRLLLGAAIAYAVSPIDLIPDFIPVLGYLDDLVVLPLLIGCAIRLIPADVLAECRAQAAKRESVQAEARQPGQPG